MADVGCRSIRLRGGIVCFGVFCTIAWGSGALGSVAKEAAVSADGAWGPSQLLLQVLISIGAGTIGGLLSAMDSGDAELMMALASWGVTPLGQETFSPNS